MLYKCEHFHSSFLLVLLFLNFGLIANEFLFVRIHMVYLIQ